MLCLAIIGERCRSINLGGRVSWDRVLLICFHLMWANGRCFQRQLASTKCFENGSSLRQCRLASVWNPVHDVEPVWLGCDKDRRPAQQRTDISSCCSVVLLPGWQLLSSGSAVLGNGWPWASPSGALRVKWLILMKSLMSTGRIFKYSGPTLNTRYGSRLSGIIFGSKQTFYRGPACSNAVPILSLYRLLVKVVRHGSLGGRTWQTTRWYCRRQGTSSCRWICRARRVQTWDSTEWC